MAAAKDLGLDVAEVIKIANEDGRARAARQFTSDAGDAGFIRGIAIFG
jgi:hypothetical protein